MRVPVLIAKVNYEQVAKLIAEVHYGKHIIEQRLLHGIVTGQKLQQGCLTLLNRGCSMQALLSLGFNKTATNISEEGAALRSCHWKELLPNRYACKQEAQSPAPLRHDAYTNKA